VTIIPKKKKKTKKGAKFANITSYESFFLKKEGKGGPSVLLAT
jgi:hypothetical protein